MAVKRKTVVSHGDNDGVEDGGEVARPMRWLPVAPPPPATSDEEP